MTLDISILLQETGRVSDPYGEVRPDRRVHLGRALLILAVALAEPVSAQTANVAAAAAAIMQADRDFNQAVAEKNREKFAALIVEGAAFNVGQAAEAHGRDAIVKSWAAFFEKDGPTLTWAPTTAEVLVGGDVGVTFGEWVRRARSSDGHTTETRGQYTTTWLKQPDGTWKVIFDIGSTRP